MTTALLVGAFVFLVAVAGASWRFFAYPAAGGFLGLEDDDATPPAAVAEPHEAQ